MTALVTLRILCGCRKNVTFRYARHAHRHHQVPTSTPPLTNQVPTSTPPPRPPGCDAAIARIKVLNGEEIAMNEITDATWPKRPEVLNYGRSGRGRGVYLLRPGINGMALARQSGAGLIMSDDCAACGEYEVASEHTAELVRDIAQTLPIGNE